MNNNQNPYNQAPQQMPMTPPPMPPRGQWQRRAINAIERVRGVSFPKWLTQYGAVAYVLALVVVSFMYSAYSLPWYYMLSGIVAMIVFFYYGKYMSDRYSVAKVRTEKNFEKQIFIIAIFLRLIWTVFIYYININYYGDTFGFENGDTTLYDELGNDFANGFRNGNFIATWNTLRRWIDVSDMGYAVYVGIIYWLTDTSILTVRLLKCVWSAITVVLVYRISKRNFDFQTARIAAIFVALWPNFWYYCGTHLKETEMVFLGVLFVEQADQMLRSRQFTAWKVVPILLIAAALFTIRTPLALVALLSLIFSVVMSSSRVVNWGKRVIVGMLAVLLIGVTMGNRIQEESQQLFNAAKGNMQKENMEWRSRRQDGNAFAKYAGKSVFAPLIFTIPFPTMVRPYEGQEVQQLNNGGNFIKNIMSGFTIFAMVLLLISGRWREHLLPLSFMLGYLVVLTMSNFAQSERFHQPAMPFELMFAAYGLSIAVTKPKYKRWFMYWCCFMLVAAIGWNWFKLAGRGLA